MGCHIRSVNRGLLNLRLPLLQTIAPISTSPIVFNCPTHRRTWEKRAQRRFGVKQWGTQKMPQFNRNIRVDHKTGEYFEVGKLAPQTYKKVMDETREIQKRMSESFGTGLPKDQEVLVVYEGEQSSVVGENMKIVEMERVRPSFFAANLLQKSHGQRDQIET